FFTPYLLGGQIRWSTNRIGSLGEWNPFGWRLCFLRSAGSGGCRPLFRFRRYAAGMQKLGHTEIEDLNFSAFCNKDVCGLDIAMEDTFFVGCLQSTADLDSNTYQLVQAGRRRLVCGLRDPLPECLAFQKRHYDEGLILMFLKFVDRADIGMFQRRRCPGFVIHPTQRLRSEPNFGWQKLDSNAATQLEVFRLINNSHTSAPKKLENSVV